MGNLIIYLFFCVLVCSKDIWCKSLNRKVEVQNGLNNDDKIVGGEDTTIQHYPYQAHLLLSSGRHKYQCGGSIVSQNYIVTAAHCLPGAQSIQVRIGSAKTNCGGTTYYTTQFNYHPLYNGITIDHDVGIVTVQDGMALDGSSAKAIAMVGFGDDPQEGTYMIVTGWGKTAEDGTPSQTLQVARVPVVSRTKCNNQIGGGVTSRMFCAGFKKGGVDACQGDSGGPVVSSDSGRLTGITSHGYGCARPNSPGVYTRIGNYVIRAYIAAMTGLVID